MPHTRSVLLAFALLFTPLVSEAAQPFPCPLVERYEVRPWRSPAQYTGDFDGDGAVDTAAQIFERESGKKGIAVCFATSRVPSIIGAGTAIGNAGDDFDWMDGWSVEPDSPSQVGARRRDALHLVKEGSASGLVYFDGAAFQWRQIGD